MKKTISILILILAIGFNGYAQEKTISKINIEGLKKTKESFLRRLIKVKEGSTYDSIKIATDVDRLNRLAGIANATSKLEEHSPSEYTLTYTIIENFTIIPGVRLSTANNDDDVAFRLSAFEFNLFGRNQIIGGFYARDVFDSFGLFWEAPFLFSNKFGFGINYQDNITFEPIFINDDLDNGNDYRFQNKTFQAFLSYEFNFHNRAELGFLIGDQSYDLQEDQIDIPELPNQLEATNFSITGEYEYNDLDIFYQYTSGYIETKVISSIFSILEAKVF